MGKRPLRQMQEIRFARVDRPTFSPEFGGDAMFDPGGNPSFGVATQTTPEARRARAGAATGAAFAAPAGRSG